MNQTFSAANPTFLAVPLELPIVMREYKGGLYHLVAWYVAKNVSELPMQIILPTVFFVPAYLLMGIGHGFDVFLSMLLVIILVNSSAVGLAHMVSCTVRRVAIAPIVGVGVILPFLLFGGLFINSGNCPEYFIWVQYISPTKYGFEALMKIFWSGVSIIPCDVDVETCVATTGAQVLHSFQMESRSVFIDILILIAINFGFRFVGFIALWTNLRKLK